MVVPTASQIFGVSETPRNALNIPLTVKPKYNTITICAIKRKE